MATQPADKREAWYVRPFIFVGCLLLALTAPLWLALSVLSAFLMGRLQESGERKFLRRLRKCGRFIAWADLEPRLTAGEGTLIFEQGFKAPVRVWWSPDDLRAVAPSPPPDEAEISTMTVAKRPHEFVSWCRRRYTDEHEGKALATIPDAMNAGYIHAPEFQKRYPRSSMIDTVYDW